MRLHRLDGQRIQISTLRGKKTFRLAVFLYRRVVLLSWSPRGWNDLWYQKQVAHCIRRPSNSLPER